MYDIKAVVGRRSDLGSIAALDARFCVVDLAFPPFVLLPLDEIAFPALRALWNLPAPDADPIDAIEPDVLKALAIHMAAILPQSAFALVEAESFGGGGWAIGLAVHNGKIVVFDTPDGHWPDTNISMVLKSIGIPERIEDRQDAFDVADLGRFRRVGEWRDSLTAS